MFNLEFKNFVQIFSQKTKNNFILEGDKGRLVQIFYSIFKANNRSEEPRVKIRVYFPPDLRTYVPIHLCVHFYSIHTKRKSYGKKFKLDYKRNYLGEFVDQMFDLREKTVVNNFEMQIYEKSGKGCLGKNANFDKLIQFFTKRIL